MRKNFVGEHSWGFWWVQRKDAYTFSCNIGYKSWVRFYFYFSLPTRTLRKTVFFSNKKSCVFFKIQSDWGQDTGEQIEHISLSANPKKRNHSRGPRNDVHIFKMKRRNKFLPRKRNVICAPGAEPEPKTTVGVPFASGRRKFLHHIRIDGVWNKHRLSAEAQKKSRLFLHPHCHSCPLAARRLGNPNYRQEPPNIFLMTWFFFRIWR